MTRRAFINIFVTGILCVVLAGAGWWADRTVFNSEEFRRIGTASLADEESVEALAALTLDYLFADQPEIRTQLTGLAEGAIARIIGSDVLRGELEDLADSLHSAVTEEPGDIVLAVGEFYPTVVGLVEAVAPSLAAELPSAVASITLFAAEELPDLSRLAGIITFLWVLALVLAVVAFVWLTIGSERPGALRFAGIGLGIGGLATVALTGAGRWYSVRSVESEPGRIVLGNTFDALADPLVTQSLILAACGALVYAGVRVIRTVLGRRS
jgi:hypothetical protein